MSPRDKQKEPIKETTSVDARQMGNKTSQQMTVKDVANRINKDRGSHVGISIGQKS